MPEIADESEHDPLLLNTQIVEQIEYYFGDFNMMKDKFLKQEVTKEDGWISVKLLLRFNRLAALTKKIDVVLDAFKENPSVLVEVDFENQRIRRNPEKEIPEPGENWRNSVAVRSIYIKGFPVETTSFDDILKFIHTFGKIDNVFKRKYYDKILKKWRFKGSAYVTFPTREDAEKFMSIKSIKFAGNELIRKWQTEYLEEKKAERMQQKLKAKETKDQLLQEQREEIEKDLKKLPTGALIHLTDITKDISIHELKNKLLKNFDWDVAFIDYNSGEPEAYVRLQEENSAKEALSKLSDNSFELAEITIKAGIVDGEKETEILTKMEAEKNSRVLQNFMRGKNKGKKMKGKKKVKQEKNGDIKPNIHIKIEQIDEPESSSMMDVVKIKTEPNSDDSLADATSLKRKIEASSSNEIIKKPKSEN